MITQQRLKELVDYDPKTGVFIRKTLVRGKGVIGEVVGMKDRDGYLKASFHGRRYFLHRLAWLYVYGVFPKNVIDHINGIPDDNRIKNLRDVSIKVNAQNQTKAQASSKTKLLGVCWHKHKNLFMASIRVDGVVKFLGYFKKAEEGHKKYLEAKRQFHVGCTI